MRSRTLFWLAVAALISLSVTACTAAPNSDKTAQDEYAAIAEKYPLPGGAGYPALPLESDGEHVVYDEDAAAMSALMKYQCAWEAEAVAGTSSKPRLTAALTALQRLTVDPVWTANMDSTGQKQLADDMTKAKLGDTSALASDVEVNCK